MRDLLDQIEVAINGRIYLVALFTSLAIPDICGAIGSENGCATQQKYIDWYDKNAKQICSYLSGEDCYFFRCSLLHQGSSQHPKNTYRRVLFVEPGKTRNVFHCNVLNDALNIDLKIFCGGLIESARTWVAQNQNTDRYKKNTEKFMQRYSMGLPPYIVGVPVIR